MTKAERKAENKPYTEDDLMKKIGRLEVENDFLRSVSKACGIESRKAQVEENHPLLSVNRQLQLLKVPRSSYYYKSQKKISKVASDERAKDEIMDIFYDTPFYASSPFDRRIETAWFQHQSQTGSPFAESVGLADDISPSAFQYFRTASGT